MTPATERRLLQAAVLVGGLVPVSAGLSGALLGPRMVDAMGSADLDSHTRYLSGILLGLGLAAWAMVPSVERRGEAFRLLAFAVLVGGLARLAGLALGPTPGLPMRLALVMELVVTPGLALWQARVARRLGALTQG